MKKELKILDGFGTFAMGLLLGGLIGKFHYYYTEGYSFDCPADYKGQIVVESHGGGVYSISNGCDYDKVCFPALYSYTPGDTVGKPTFEEYKAHSDKVSGDALKELKMSQSIKELDIATERLYESIKESKKHN